MLVRKLLIDFLKDLLMRFIKVIYLFTPIFVMSPFICKCSRELWTFLVITLLIGTFMKLRLDVIHVEKSNGFLI